MCLVGAWKLHSQAILQQLLSLWAHGKVSAAEVQRLSHLANLDGCTHPEIALLASAGNYGEQPGNCHRALLRSFCQKVSVVPPCLQKL